jgi:hypothetical protein
LIVLWEAADRICGKRLKTILPLLRWPSYEHLDLQNLIPKKLALQTSGARLQKQ